jgi:autotransporter translocation and assembly factor TamB
MATAFQHRPVVLRMSRGRRVIRWIALTLGVSLLLVALGLIVVQTDWFKDWLRRQAVTRVATILNGELRIARLGGNLWTGVTLDGVDIVQSTGSVITAQRIRVRYDPWNFVHRHWVFDEIVLEQPFVHLAQTASGWNVTQLIKARTTPGPGATFSIGRLRMIGGTVAILPLNATPRTLRAVDLDSALEVDRGRIDMRVASLRAFDEASGFTVHDVAGTASNNFQTFDVRLTADSPRASVGGRVQGSTSGAGRLLNGDIDLNHVDLAQVLGNPAVATDLTGHVVSTALIPTSGLAHAKFDYTGSQTQALGYKAEVLHATGDVDREHVVFNARATAYGADATVAGTVHFPTDRHRTTFTGRGTYARLDMRRLPPIWRMPAFATVLAGNYDVTVGEREIQAKTTLNASTFEGATIAAGTNGVITIAGGVTRYTATGTVAHLNVPRLATPLAVPTLSDPRLAGSVSGQFSASGQETGKPEGRILDAEAALESSELSGTRVPAMQTQLHWHGARLDIAANGAFEHLNETLTTPNPAVAFALDGRVNGTFTIRDVNAPMSADNLEIDGRAELGASTVRQYQIDNAIIDGRMTDGVVAVREFDVHGPLGTVKAKGQIALGTTGASNLQVNGEFADLAPIGELVGQPLAGGAVVDATVTGTATSPSATGTATLHQFAYGDVASALVSTIKFSGDWPNRDNDRLHAKLDTESSFIEIKGHQLQQITATVDGNLTEMSVDLRASEAQREMNLRGQVLIDKDSQQLKLEQLMLATQGMSWGLADGRPASIRYGGGRIAISDLALVRNNQRIDIAGSFDADTPKTPAATPAIGITVKAQQVELADINHILLGTREMTGRIDGTIVLQGARQNPLVDANVTVANGSVQGVAYDSVTGHVTYKDHLAAIEALLVQSPGVEVRATGTVPVAASDGVGSGLDVHVVGGPVNLGLAQAFTTEITNVVGTTTMDVRVTGSVKAPDIRGNVTLAGGAFTVASTGAKYRDLNASLLLEGSHLAVSQFQMADSDGHLLTAQGGLDVLGEVAERHVDIQVRADDVAMLRNQFGSVDVDADVHLSGTFEAPVIKGTIELDTGRLEVARILERTTRTPYSTEAQTALSEKGPPAGPPSFFDRIAMDVQIKIPDNLVLRGRDLRVADSSFGIGDMNILVGGELSMTKAPNAPLSVVGGAEVAQGYYSFQGRRFEIERGSDVRFHGGAPTDPTLNFTGTREVAGVTAEVRVQGTPSRPRIALSSQPPLDEGDILSLIVFNQPMSQLGEGERVNLGERAASMAAGAVATPLADSIGRVLNLDVVELQAPTSESGSGSVTVGNRIGSRVFVGLRQVFGHDEASVFSLEYRINEVLRFVTSIAQGTLEAHATRRVDQSGVDLMFVIRY